MIPYTRQVHMTAVALLLLCLPACGTGRHAIRDTRVQDAAGSPVTAVTPAPLPQADTPGDDGEEIRDGQRGLVVERADGQSWLGRVQQSLDSLCGSPISETSQLGLYIYDLTDGHPVYAHNALHRMRPASCEKLVTCITLLDREGGLRPLTTEVIATGRLSGGVLQGDLYLRGDMDPLLTRANLDTLACALRQAGIDSVAGRVCEMMPPYEVPPYGWGWCWDDDYGPLAAHLVGGAEGMATLWPEALARAGVRLRGEYVSEVKGLEGEVLVAFALEHPVDEVMRPVLKRSDNIYAECLFYRLASMGGHRKTARQQAASVVDSLITRLGLHPRDYLIADGSGLSLYNYVTPQLLVALLNHAYRDEAIRQRLMPCLPIAGVDGTLRRRMAGTAAQGNVRAKTGTVEGVSSLSGYLTAANGHTLSFSIINQGVARTRTGQRFQDQVCLLLCR